MSDVDLAAMYPTMAIPPAPVAPAAPSQPTPPSAAAPNASAPPAESAPPTPSQAPTSPSLPENIAALRASDPLLKMYEASKQYNAGALDAAFETDLETPPAVQAAFKSEILGMAFDCGLDQADLDHLVATSRALNKTPPDAAKTESMRAEATRLLVDRFGKGAAGALAGARQLAQRDPRMATMLSRNHFGDDPRTVLRLAELAVRERSRGRLK